MGKLKQIVAKILNIREDDVNADLSPDNTESWDSFNHLLIISEIEKDMGIQIPIDKVSEIRNFADLCKLVKGD
jgi:acyl carrier protein